MRRFDKYKDIHLDLVEQQSLSRHLLSCPDIYNAIYERCVVLYQYCLSYI